MSEIKNYFETESGEFDPSRIGYPIPEDLDYQKWLDKVNAENLAYQITHEGKDDESGQSV